MRGPIYSKFLDVECLDELPMPRVQTGQFPVQDCRHMSVFDSDVCRSEVTVRKDYVVVVATEHATNERTYMTLGSAVAALKPSSYQIGLGCVLVKFWFLVFANSSGGI